MMKIRLYADFNARTGDDKVVLNTVGSLADIDKHEADLTEGMKVILSDTEIEVEAQLERDRESGVWLGAPDWPTLRHLT